MANGRYILDSNGNPVEENDLLTWGRWLENAPNREVGRDTTAGGAQVSTVFLGLDHGFGRPVLWETMIFGGPLDGFQARYTSLEDALAGHVDALMKAWEAETGA
jgi:hypothetical protein